MRRTAMDGHPTNEELWTALQEQRSLLDEQRAEIARLKKQLGQQIGPPGPSSRGREKISPPGRRRLSRASLLKGAAVGAAGVIAADATGFSGSPVHAARREVTDSAHAYQYEAFAGEHETAFWTTGAGLFDNGAILQAKYVGLQAGSYLPDQMSPGPGTGVIGTSGTGTGVQGQATSKGGVAVRGTAYSRFTPSLSKPEMVGVLGEGDDKGLAVGVLGTGYVGVRGEASGAGQAGVEALSKAGPGVFAHIDAGNGSPAVLGRTAGPGVGVQGEGAPGVWGVSDQGVGVRAETGSSIRAACAGLNKGNGIGIAGLSFSDYANNTLGSGPGVEGHSGTGSGVHGVSAGGSGVAGEADTGIGVSASSNGTALYASSTGGYGVYGTSEQGPGVFASAHAPGQPAALGVNYAQGTGVLGRSSTGGKPGHHRPGSGTGVAGESGSGIGVQGTAATGRGGVFSGGAAQLQLVPSSAKAPPAEGLQGDIFLDSKSKLWLCTASADPETPARWTNLGAGGGGKTGSGPLAGQSADFGTPAVDGDNTAGGTGVRGTSTGGVQGIGVYGVSLGAQNGLGAGWGLFGVSGTGAGVGANSTSGTGIEAGGVRGGYFAGSKAQIQLQPASGNHPTDGLTGDLFLDSTSRLWLCTAGGNPATWKQVQLL